MNEEEIVWNWRLRAGMHPGEPSIAYPADGIPQTRLATGTQSMATYGITVHRQDSDHR